MTKDDKKKEQGRVCDWPQSKIDHFQSDLLSWYDQRKRDLPWRQNQDPYRIWVSEIMLQQTQVITVIPHFERFMEWFPTIQALAEAPEEKLLKAWEGLGYYSRVRNMQVAAQQIVADFSGEMPNNIEAISSLKGIGPYTAGAISSIAFDLPEPAIDGNVMRVYSRLFQLSDDIAKASSRKVFDKVVRETISHEDPSSFNQALMDLGATICKPTSPECQQCPLQNYCLSYERETTLEYPVKSKKQKAKPVYYQGHIIRNQTGEFLIEQRAEKGLLANLWQFPLIEVGKASQTSTTFQIAESTEQSLYDVNREIVWQKESLGEVTHIFSHLKWFVNVCYGMVKEGETFPLADNQKWVSMTEMLELPMPKPQLKMIDLFNEVID